jgi:hypothetical protein
MTDTFYGMECLARERARAIDREVQRRRLLAQAQGPHRPARMLRLLKRVGEGLVRAGQTLVRLADGVSGRRGMDACRR